jgi:hypothetical protein
MKKDLKVKILIAELREQMIDMSAQERLDLISNIIAGYCIHCGYKIERRCYCKNDE